MPAHALMTDQLRLPLQRDLPARADGFVRSGSNEAAVALLDGWPAADRPHAGRVMAMYGPAGCGKSHLAAIWAERVGAVALNGAEAALADPIELAGRPVLLDDAWEADDEALFHLINLAQTDGGALLMVARQPPRGWTVALPDLRSRLDALPTAALEEPDDRVLAAILRARFAERSIAPAEEVIDYLVRRIDRSAEAAADVIERLDARHRPVTRVLAREVMAATPEDEPGA